MSGKLQDEDPRRFARQLVALGHVGLMFPVAIALGFLAGRVLDSWLGTAPWLAFAGFLLGVVTAIRELVRSTARLAREEQQADAEATQRRREARREPGADEDA